MLIVEMCVCVCVGHKLFYNKLTKVFFAIIAFYSIWCWELNHRAESSYSVSWYNICTSTSFLKTSSGNLVKSILTKLTIWVHYIYDIYDINDIYIIWNMKFIAQPKLAMFLCSRAVLFKKKVVNQLSFYRNSSNMFITKTNKYIHVCLGVLKCFHSILHTGYCLLCIFCEIESILKYWYYVIF